MLFDTELCSRVIVPVQNLQKGGHIPKSLVMMRLLYQLSVVKATAEIGYFLAVTKLKSIEKDGSGTVCCECQSSHHLIFRVTFCCRTFMPQKGEVMVGTVYRVLRRGVMIKCGPMNLVYLSSQLMPTYQYVEEEDPFYLSNDLSRIQKDVFIRFMVFAFRWNDGDSTRRQFEILATIQGDCLGPISLAGSDEMEL